MSTQIERPPVIAIMGHVDHGKSSLLDYIRKTNIVAGEAGGITQHLSAYEVIHINENGVEKKITFIDTPGHAAFSGMRHRGAAVADIAILIVSAEDSVKEQTKEAIRTILDNKVPFLVAINKIDKPNANPEKVKIDLMEEGIYVEGYGGDIPVVLISAKNGTGVSELLDTILLVSELEGFTGDPKKSAEGFVIESHLDDKRGISATLVIKNGTVRKGDFIVVDNVYTSTRLLENFNGQSIDEATFSAPIRITGFDDFPNGGSLFETYATKKEAEKAIEKNKQERVSTLENRIIGDDELVAVIPVIIKSDVYGTAEAIEGEVKKLSTDDVWFKIIKKGIGNINESDVQLALSDTSTIIIGFHVDIDKKIKDVIDSNHINVHTFSIIYKISEWLEQERTTRKPKRMVDEILGTLKILKTFSRQKNTSVVGGRVESGILEVGKKCKITRKGEVLATGIITNIQHGKMDAKSLEAGNECGIAIDTSYEEIQSGDMIETYQTIEK